MRKTMVTIVTIFLIIAGFASTTFSSDYSAVYDEVYTETHKTYGSRAFYDSCMEWGSACFNIYTIPEIINTTRHLNFFDETDVNFRIDMLYETTIKRLKNKRIPGYEVVFSDWNYYTLEADIECLFTSNYVFRCFYWDFREGVTKDPDGNALESFLLIEDGKRKILQDIETIISEVY